MKRTGKWIDGTSPEQPVTEAARSALRLRLKLVSHYLPLAAWEADDDPEYVHQLRVATRRANSALGIFADLLPRRRLRKLKRQLHGVRRAAGEARDLDVLLARLTKLADDSPGPGWEELLSDLQARRKLAQPAIRQVDKKLREGKFRKRIRELVARIQVRDAAAPRTPTFVEAARQALTPLVEKFFTAVRGPLEELAAMHQCRIHGKKLRYAMEIFSGAFSPEFRAQLYPEIEQVQELLGEINDRATACQEFSTWLAGDVSDETRALLAGLLASEAAALEAAKQSFLSWRSEERTAGLAAQFGQYLGTLRVVPAAPAAAVG